RPPPNGLAAAAPPTHAFCNALGSGYLIASPLRSVVVEWQRAQTLSKYLSPAFASPTRMLSVSPTGFLPGGLPCPPVVGRTLWMYSATATVSPWFRTILGLCAAIASPTNSPC